MRSYAAVQLTDAIAKHGEGAIWDADLGCWLWVDMLAGRVLRTDEDGSTLAHHIPDPVAALVRPHAAGGHIVVGERTVWWIDIVDNPDMAIAIAELPIDAKSRANEGGCNGQGQLTVGSLAYSHAPHGGQVVTFNHDGTTFVALAGATVSNGTVFEHSRSVLFADSATHQVCSFEVDADGIWRNRTVVIDLSDEVGVPDGICTDLEGGIWVAMWGGSCVQRWTRAGRKTDEIAVPTPHVTSVALGAADRQTLFITTSAVDRPITDTAAGAAYIARTEVPGRTVFPCSVPARPPWTTRTRPTGRD